MAGGYQEINDTAPDCPVAVGLQERRRGKNLLPLALKVEKPLRPSSSSNASGSDIFERTDSRYQKCDCIGHGSLSVVYRAVDKTQRHQVALKVVRTPDMEVINISRAEFALMQRIVHPNIVRALDFFVLSGKCSTAVLVMNLFPGSQLGSSVSNTPDRRLSDPTARTLFEKLLSALDHIHRLRIVHRDVKPENVLVTDDFSDLHLIDFNVSCYLLDGGALSPRCTPAYAPPEVRKGGSASDAGDVWGAGLCLCMMISGTCSVKEDGKVDLSRCVASAACFATLNPCLATEPSMRPAAMSLLQTVWISGASQWEPSPGFSERQRALSAHRKSWKFGSEDLQRPSGKASSDDCPEFMMRVSQKCSQLLEEADPMPPRSPCTPRTPLTPNTPVAPNDDDEPPQGVKKEVWKALADRHQSEWRALSV